MTSAGSLLGTPAFMPPELALGQPCDGRADLYSLGCILYLIGSGRLPFVSESAHELIAMHGTQPAPPMTGVPEALAHVVDRLLEKEPSRRFQTAAETREALEASLGQRVATPVSGVARMSPPSLLPQQISAFVSSDTVAAASTLRPAKKRNLLGPILGALALVVGGVVAFALTRHTAEKPAVTAPPPVVIEQPEPPPPPPVVEPPKPAEVAAPPVTVEKAVVEKPVVEKPVVEKPVVEKPVVKKPVKKPNKSTTKPASTQQVTGSGSASKPALPF